MFGIGTQLARGGSLRGVRLQKREERLIVAWIFAVPAALSGRRRSHGRRIAGCLLHRAGSLPRGRLCLRRSRVALRAVSIPDGTAIEAAASAAAALPIGKLVHKVWRQGRHHRCVCTVHTQTKSAVRWLLMFSADGHSFSRRPRLMRNLEDYEAENGMLVRALFSCAKRADFCPLKKIHRIVAAMDFIAKQVFSSKVRRDRFS